MLNFVLLIIGFVFYYLAYRSPKTDLILYGISGIIFMLTAVTGFAGYGDIQTSEQISYTYTTFENQTVVQNEIRTPIYSEHIIFKSGLPIIQFLAGLYILIVLGVEERTEKDAGKKQSGN